MNREEGSIAARLPPELLILINEQVHQWDLSNALFWKSRNRLLRSMVRVNKHWVGGSARCVYIMILRAGFIVECSSQQRAIAHHRPTRPRFDGSTSSFTPPLSIFPGSCESIENELDLSWPNFRL